MTAAAILALSDAAAAVIAASVAGSVAIGVAAIGYAGIRYQARFALKQASEAKTDSITAMSHAADAKSQATAARDKSVASEAATQMNSQKLDEIARDTGKFEALYASYEAIARQAVDMASSNAALVERVTTELGECNKNRAEDARAREHQSGELRAARTELSEVRIQVVSLTNALAAVAPGVVQPITLPPTI